MRKLKQTGDTIVEVLIALSVIGAVIAGAFEITNSSLQTERDSQARSEALQIAQNQVESLKTLVFNEGLTNFFTPATFQANTTFCLNNNLIQGIGGTCAFDQNGNFVNLGSSVYTVSIKNIMPIADPPAEQWSQVEVLVTWAGANSTNNLTLYYGFNNYD